MDLKIVDADKGMIRKRRASVDWMPYREAFAKMKPGQALKAPVGPSASAIRMAAMIHGNLRIGTSRDDEGAYWFVCRPKD